MEWLKCGWEIPAASDRAMNEWVTRIVAGSWSVHKVGWRIGNNAWLDTFESDSWTVWSFEKDAPRMISVMDGRIYLRFDVLMVLTDRHDAHAQFQSG